VKLEIDNSHAARLKKIMPGVFSQKNNAQQRRVIEEIVDELLTDFCTIAEVELSSEEGEDVDVNFDFNK